MSVDLIRLRLEEQIVAIILAAGDSSRMGSPKTLMRIGGTTFLERVVDLYRSLHLPRCVILGRLISLITKTVHLPGTIVLNNPDPSKGPLSSLLIGLRKAERSSAIILHPVDHPLVLESTIVRLLAVHRENPSCILIPECSGRKGHPILIPQKYYPDLQSAPLNEGARSVVRAYRSANYLVKVEDPGVLLNIDTIQQYRWLTGFPPLDRPPSLPD